MMFLCKFYFFIAINLFATENGRVLPKWQFNNIRFKTSYGSGAWKFYMVCKTQCDICDIAKVIRIKFTAVSQ